MLFGHLRRPLALLCGQTARLSTPPAPAGKWDLAVGVALIRPCVVAPPMSEVERNYHEIAAREEFESSLKSEFELRLIKDGELLEKRRKLEEEGKDLSQLDEEIGITAQQLEADWKRNEEVARRQFGLGDRAAVREANPKSLRHQLDRKIVLLLANENESLRQTVDRCLKETLSGAPQVVVEGNAPMSVYKYRYPKPVAKKQNAEGSYVFLYAAHLQNADADLQFNKNHVHDHRWCTTDELLQLLPAQHRKYGNKVRHLITRAPAVSARPSTTWFQSLSVNSGDMSRRFDRLLENATDQSLVEPDWEHILECVDAIRGGDVPVKSAPPVHSEAFHAEIATKDFMEDLKNLVIENAPDKVKNKVLELIQCWSSAFEKYPEYKIVGDTLSFMKMYGYEFPKLKEADAMFMAEMAPDWAEGDSCFRCRVEFGIFTRKHHCRSCGQVFCDKCSSRQMMLPHLGIEKKVRVCETCFNKSFKEPSKPAEKALQQNGERNGASSNAEEEARQRELQEQEELQLALAISQSEAEAKEQERQRGGSLYRREELGSAAAPFSEPPKMESTPSTSERPREATSNATLMSGMDIKASAPPPSEMSFSSGGPTASEFAAVNPYPHLNGAASLRASASATPNGLQASYNGLPVDGSNIFLDQGIIDLTNMAKQQQQHQLASMNEVEQTKAFCDELREQVDTMNNRMRSNMLRGRPIINDSAIHSLFARLTAKHEEVLSRMADLDAQREHFEGLQDRLAHIQETRQALNALREEHENQRRARLGGGEPRPNTRDMLFQQRQAALQRFQQQEFQAQQRRVSPQMFPQQQPQADAAPQQYHPQMPPMSQPTPAQHLQMINQMQAMQLQQMQQHPMMSARARHQQAPPQDFDLLNFLGTTAPVPQPAHVPAPPPAPQQRTT
ncbi:Hepatocyte growth factor-regulated tyrosine kinase substrate [Aphelenchoides fujianensis]|nr:Hepatocyte growth factor-regulated tyrosine kinase substrate [Aphelenchoides fujianensis]